MTFQKLKLWGLRAGSCLFHTLGQNEGFTGSQNKTALIGIGNIRINVFRLTHMGRHSGTIVGAVMEGQQKGVREMIGQNHGGRMIEVVLTGGDVQSQQLDVLDG